MVNARFLAIIAAMGAACIGQSSAQQSSVPSDALLASLAHYTHPSSYLELVLRYGIQIDLESAARSSEEWMEVDGLRVAAPRRLRRLVEALASGADKPLSAFNEGGLLALARAWLHDAPDVFSDPRCSAIRRNFVIDHPHLAAYSSYNDLDLPDITYIRSGGTGYIHDAHARSVFIVEPRQSFHPVPTICELLGVPPLHPEAVPKFASNVKVSSSGNWTYLRKAFSKPNGDGRPLSWSIIGEGPLLHTICVTNGDNHHEVRSVVFAPNERGQPQEHLRQIAKVQLLGDQLVVALHTLYRVTPLDTATPRVPVNVAARLYDGVGEESRRVGSFKELSANGTEPAAGLIPGCFRLTGASLPLWRFGE